MFNSYTYVDEDMLKVMKALGKWIETSPDVYVSSVIIQNSRPRCSITIYYRPEYVVTTETPDRPNDFQ